MRQAETPCESFASGGDGFIVTKMEELNFIEVRIGKHICRCNYKIVGVTASAIDKFNQLIAKGEHRGIYGTGKKS